ESDYAFFSRLAAEEGCSFWFEDETAFFSDSHLGMTAGLPLQYQPHRHRLRLQRPESPATGFTGAKDPHDL
ncbi:hypothetical protein KKI93_26610, partial [Xenorhabdus bovienii]